MRLKYGSAEGSSGKAFIGVEKLHHLVSLQFKMNMLPIKWEAMRRGIKFWVQVMRLGQGRILKLVMLEILELGKGVRREKNLQLILEMFGWRGLNLETLSGLSMKEVNHCMQFQDIAWRNSKVREV